MNQKKSAKKLIRKIYEGRAARTFAVVASAFLCVMTLLEFRVLAEITLDDSTENILLEEAQIGQFQVSETEQSQALGIEQRQDEETEQLQDEEMEQFQGEKTELPQDEGIEQFQNDKTEQLQNEEAEVSKDEAAPQTEFPYYIKVNRKQNCITVYTLDETGEYTEPYRAMICSTGRYNATPRGTFQLSTKYLWRELYGGVYGQYATRIHGGILFHSVPYYRKSKGALCTDKYNKLGQQASMGCIRLTVEDAKWIAENCPEGTSVEIYDDDDPGPLGKPEAAQLDTDSPNKGWDPTDPDADNPWNQVSEDK